MDARERLGLAVLILASLLFTGWWTYTPPTKDFPAYCIDPFASEDLGRSVFTPCTAVPMWSVKV